MSTYINVARYHLVQRFNYFILPWAILAFVFGVDVVILALTPAGDSSHRYVGGLASIFVIAFVLGTQSVARSLPFGLALGLSRRSYYLGTALLAAAFAAIVASVVTVGQAIERATGGWGLSMGFFRVPYILDGRWYLTWPTAFVALTLLFVYGMWFGLVYRRWNLVGLASFLAAQITVLLIAALAATWAHGWHDVGHFFTELSAAGLTAVLAAITVALLAGGFTTMRRITV
ncbi:ABC transporter permease [Jatrophihabitans sp. DSM 45814]